jgi:hypothetical protein
VGVIVYQCCECILLLLSVGSSSRYMLMCIIALVVAMVTFSLLSTYAFDAAAAVSSFFSRSLNIIFIICNMPHNSILYTQEVHAIRA